jgi:transcriptional regulator with XRE-family HTH domain
MRLIREGFLMGKAVRERPTRLAEKLLAIRQMLGLSQNGLIRRMGLTDAIVQADISTYELNQREPPLKILLEYARVAAGGVEGAAQYLEILIDDALDLPEQIPNPEPTLNRKAQRNRHQERKNKR